MSDPKFYCRAEDLAIRPGKNPPLGHIGPRDRERRREGKRGELGGRRII